MTQQEIAQHEPDLSSAAALIGEPTRATILTALMTGLALPAGELAELAGVSPQTASMHLQKLLENNMVSVETQGRHRYYRLENSDVAVALEALMVIAPTQPKKRQLPNQDMCYARTCYDHLAGWLGVLLCQTMLENNWITQQHLEFTPTELGKNKLASLGIQPSQARACLDWTERRHHIGGELGRNITTYLLEQKWVVRHTSSRALRVTEKGILGLRDVFGMRL